MRGTALPGAGAYRRWRLARQDPLSGRQRRSGPNRSLRVHRRGRRHGGGTIVNARFALPEGPALERPAVGAKAVAEATLACLVLAVLLALRRG